MLEEFLACSVCSGCPLDFSLIDSALPTSNKTFPATFRAFLQIVITNIQCLPSGLWCGCLRGDMQRWKGHKREAEFCHLQMPEHAELTKGQGVIRILVLNQGVATEFTN